MAATYDMITSGPQAGEVVRPLTYTAADPATETTVEDNAARVRVYLELATPKDTYRLDLPAGLDVDRIMDPATSDAERSALVRRIVEADPHTDRVTVGPDVEITDDGKNAAITVEFVTKDGATIGLGIQV